jgi:hypothetical protein
VNLRKCRAPLLLLLVGLSVSCLTCHASPVSRPGGKPAGTMPEELVPLPLPHNAPLLLWRAVPSRQIRSTRSSSRSSSIIVRLTPH